MAWEWPASPTCPPSGLGNTRCSDFLRRLVSDSVETTCARLILFDLEIYRRLLTAVTLNLVLNGLSFIERCQSGTFDGTDVYEHIFSSSLRLNEPVAFGRIEPLHSTGSHAGLLLNRTATE